MLSSVWPDTAFGGWYQAGRLGHVAAHLAKLDLALFDTKAPPPKTAAFWAIVDAHCAPKDAELADVLDSLGVRMPDGAVTWPDAVTLPDITRTASAAGSSFLTRITDRKSRRAIPHRMEQCGYVPVRNERHRGQWIINGSRQVVYANSKLSIRDRIAATQRLRNLAAHSTHSAHEVLLIRYPVAENLGSMHKMR